MTSAKVDNRGSFGSKRSRNDASRKDGDWTCPLCGNVNFGFRTVCNRGKCGAPRPPTTPGMGSVHTPSPFDNPPPFYLGGVGAPPMPLGASSNYGPQIPIRYGYGAPSGAPGPYGLMAGYPPGPLEGMSYGPGPGSGYGFGFRGPPLPMSGPWAEGGMSDNNASRKRRGGPGGLSEGDWICPKCDNINFAFRTSCNMKKCGAPRPSPGPNQWDKKGVPEGSWTCSKCDNVNYPFRTVCNRKGCGSEKPALGN